MSNWSMRASHQWAVRPDDERFTSLNDMFDHFKLVREQSRAFAVGSKRINAVAEDDHKGMLVEIGNDVWAPTHHSFGQISQLAEARAGYLRRLPSELAADCINYGLKFLRQPEDVGLLVRNNGEHILRAATGPNYGRIWNADVVKYLIERFGDGITGAWKVPGEFGKAITVTKANTTLYASDRDFFIFLADEHNRITVPNRRNGQSGSLARGFYCWNSEVGDKTFGIGRFLFDFACSNRIVWGGQDYKELTIKHTISAPDKFIDQVTPTLLAYANASAGPMEELIKQAQAKKISDDLDNFLATRFSRRNVNAIKTVHEFEEGKPIETVWDAVTATTAWARGITHQDTRVEVERQAGLILQSAA